MKNYDHILPKHYYLIDGLRSQMGVNQTAQIEVIYVWAKAGDPTSIWVWDADAEQSREEPGDPVPTKLMIEVPKEDWHAVQNHTNVWLMGMASKDFGCYLKVPIR